ncbi:CPBP family intramembrane glutamic endopeptidase [Marinitenerispora sediminis]|uniref:CAAX prenyl protease 2/Lysostaphin resistance protein A-like domain-containing protein n=1 Tax=Marinitenerispora sediminis TaxID=1931232 RepID=A0A368T5C1_9ACTN|nr:CPBP family intramembrane glutamic endopeptidase [Marinitenerispora sediminis]RCV57258.1 hypothetical protein DEF28_01875 [Marinitenerispora sediminis]RCV58279.1 hypothetical protein DEF23_09340 [Marinitenerispora sediminis]RCV58502.1 hypothetical protein DEF24_13375 [Marinitenerispora sediminis]
MEGHVPRHRGAAGGASARGTRGSPSAVCARWLRRGVRNAPRHAAAGALIGTVLVTDVVLVGQAAGWYDVDFVGVRTSWPLSLAAVLVSVVVQEVLFRGILYTAVEWLLGSAAAVLLSAVLFGAAHALLPHVTAWSVAAVALQFGILLGVGYGATRSLWFVIALDFAWSVTGGLVLGAPVGGYDLGHPLFRTETSGPEPWSGGTFGPEAGLLGIVLSGAVAVLLVSYGQGRGRFRRALWRRGRPGRRNAG